MTRRLADLPLPEARLAPATGAPSAWVARGERLAGHTPAERPAERGGPPLVLLADGDDVTVRVLRHRFERDGLAVAVVATGFDALTALRTTAPAVALVNAALVGVDGFEVLQRVRRGEAGPAALPVVVTCWAGNDALVVRAFALDADDVLVRPFSLAEASARIRRLVRRASGVRP